MTKADKIHKELIRKILTEGTWDEKPRPRYKSDGSPAHSLFISQVKEEYDISLGETPITQLRPVAIKKGIGETGWIYQDQTSDLSVLRDKHGIYWWDDWAVGDGTTIGQRYGATVKRYDLMNKILKGLKENPFGRSHIITLLQEKDLNETDGLNPCAFQTMWTCRRVNGDLILDLTLVQRSSDYLPAGHINMMQYVALQMMVAHHLGYKVGNFVRFTQNLHIYDRHIPQAYELLERTAPESNPLLILNADKDKTFYDITVDDFELINYNPIRPQLKFDLGI